MNQNQIYWHSLFRCLLMSGAIALSPLSALAQRIPIADDTLGNERSIVTPFSPVIDQIDGGARRGANLFHSFREFNIEAGRAAYFTNPDGVANILARVTGSNRSEILGTLGVDGPANLFLLNPNGILFGPNAQLDLRGSFIASTANSFLFDNGFAFSATDPQAPPLLTVNVPIGLQYGNTPGLIETQGSSLQLDNGQTLTLAGGPVTVSSGQLLAPGGRVELTGVSNAGEVGLTQQGQEWRLSVPDGLARADVAIENNAILDVSSGGGGSIAVTAQNFIGTGTRTGIRAGIAAGLGNVGTQAGDIDINTTEAMTLDASTVENIVSGTGNAGNINISVGSLSLTNGAYFDTTIYGQGNAGNISITARDRVSFNGASTFASGAYSLVNTGGVGQGGNITITTDQLSFTNGGRVSTTVEAEGVGVGGDIQITTRILQLTNGAQISASTFGQGDAGDITITARDRMSFDGVGSNGFSSAALSSVYAGAIGQAGDITITTGALSLTNGAQIGASTFGQGDAGDITITARDRMSFDGVDSNGFPSGAYNQVILGAIGQGGDITITTGSLSLTNGAQIDASTFGQGDAGDITITARDRVSFDGVGSNKFSSGAFSSTYSRAIGQGGDITVNTSSLSLTNGGVLSTSTFGQGNAGNITMMVRDLTAIDGTDSNGSPTGIYSEGSGTIGQGGDIRITTGNLSITHGVEDRAEISTDAFGQGDAGNITINARDTVSFDGSSNISSSVGAEAIGRGGDIQITTGSLFLTNGGQMSAATLGQGDAGNITINARDTVSFDGTTRNALFTSGAGSIVSDRAIGRGGDISITTNTLFITDGAALSATTFGRGNAGTVAIKARDAVFIDGADTNGIPSGIFSRVASRAEGQGGRITVNTRLFSVTNRGELTASSVGQGDAGNLNVMAHRLRLDNQGMIQAETRSGQGGNISLQVPDLLLLRNRSRISTTAGTAQAGGDGGNITFSGQFLVAVPDENSDISANAFTGRGGNVEINAQSIFGIQARLQPTIQSDITASSEAGVAGVVTINTPDVDPNRGLVELPADVTDASRLIARTCPTGDATANQPNEFIITGRGGLPPNPSEAVNQDAIQVDLVSTNVNDGSSNFQHELNSNFLSPASPIVEAQGWQATPNGEMMLIAAVSERVIAPSPNHLAHCH